MKTIKDMAICNKYEAQCETSRMLCMLSKRVEIHPYISRFGIVTVLVKELLNTRCECLFMISFILLSQHTSTFCKVYFAHL